LWAWSGFAAAGNTEGRYERASAENLPHNLPTSYPIARNGK
jgi:hypothetical protein